jgi:hypothetical protein
VLAVFAVGGRALIDRRKRRQMGAAAWQDLRARVADSRVFHAPASWAALALRVALGILGFAALLLAHPVVIGVSAL